MVHSPAKPDDLFVAVCPDCDGEEFKVIGSNSKSGKFIIEKIACVHCPTDMLVKSGNLE